ncbi:hypothetical protein GTY87_14550 [Streptomyces sp. SID7813]|uniref:Uncharacterized protein n=1 Tax=Streptomyces coelicolor (strain ATCC BAA-471 / A3(2) / M145) TaxID=100226 RepID=Q9RD89_STRCO|nr:hypothetical protein [Streptomyces sp. SID7813]QFI42963.1 hypothetical protein FQ762_14670 [Streptomyces coelicolor A3(2)]THA81790.1 hypothetical protein E6R61_35595 [Streptomyces sp. LRa12]CAB65592.1 hypothetical protein SCE20.36c [Streptomyces coelicolor A3(2)]
MPGQHMGRRFCTDLGVDGLPTGGLETLQVTAHAIRDQLLVNPCDRLIRTPRLLHPVPLHHRVDVEAVVAGVTDTRMG